MPVGLVSSAQKMQELQRWKVQHEKQSRSFLTPASSLGYLSLPLHHGHGRACTHKQQIKWETQYMGWQENIFIPFFSGTWGHRYTSNTVFSPGVLKIRKMSENWGEYSNLSRSNHKSERMASDQKYLCGSRRPGIQSMANQWASMAANVMMAATGFAKC